MVIVTYRRGWAISYALDSLTKQTVEPHEVILVLKPSNDGSEKVINNYLGKLPLQLIIQEKGNVTDAVSIGLKKAQGDLILFLDDDAIAHPHWIKRYIEFFTKFPDAGGATGFTYAAELHEDKIILKSEAFYKDQYTGIRFHRQPLKIFNGYSGFLSTSGIPGNLSDGRKIIRSTYMGGLNMGWRKEALLGCDLSIAYKESFRGFLYEHYLAFWARLRGFYTYEIKDLSIAPIVWHIQHSDSLTRGGTFKDFWMQYDRAYMYWRLKRLTKEVNFLAYIIGLLVTSRQKSFSRFLGSFYGLIRGLSFYLQYRK
ncbi:MAG: glycosyltransferase family A protein [Candidatus Bathyarchaeia archaeon]